MFETGPLVGTPEQLVERLKQAEKLGMTYPIGFFTEYSYDPSSVELFATKVMPEFA
jgi:alkanesulfonate monooxygenase SsuD/methylene tetrahydromethanopterin reductase-like flavin-dependent oxidoreductase (luciferase family)